MIGVIQTAYRKIYTAVILQTKAMRLAYLLHFRRLFRVRHTKMYPVCDTNKVNSVELRFDFIFSLFTEFFS